MKQSAAATQRCSAGFSAARGTRPSAYMSAAASGAKWGQQAFLHTRQAIARQARHVGVAQRLQQAGAHGTA